MKNIEKIKKDLKINLSTPRYEHSLLVAEEAKKLAKCYHYDENKAYLAGLVHDIAKEFSEEENQKWVKKYHLSPTILTPEFHKIAHADIGAVVIKEKYELDNDICDAVKYHTIGNIAMDTLAKIVYIADKIGRKNKNTRIEQITRLAYESLDKAILLCLNYSKEKLESKGNSLHKDSIELLQYLKTKV